MNRHTSKLAERREHEGIGRLWAAGIDPESKFLASMIPPRSAGWAWEQHPCELYYGEAMPASVIAAALGVRIKTFNDWTKEADFPPPYPVEVLLPERLLLHAEEGGYIPPEVWERYAGAHVYGRKLRRGEQLWCGEAVGLWIFATRGHRIGYAYAWWMLEAEFGTWTPESGYIEALPMTKQQWINDWRNV